MRLIWLMLGVMTGTQALAANAIIRNPIPRSDFPIAQSVVIPAGTKLIYVSGQGPSVVDESAPRFSIAAFGSTETQTLSTLETISTILKRQGLSMGNVVKMQVFLVGDPENGHRMDFAGFMRGYMQYFGTEAQPNLPARSAMQVEALANPGWLVEIEVVAAMSK
jgi:enamine deaminase RidA (YjgF/YER057c/UK114 family)